MIIKQLLHQFTPNSGRIVGILHAVTAVTVGIPVLFVLGSDSFSYADMFESFLSNHNSIIAVCNFVCYASIGYFLMDSYFLIQSPYLKHHIGAIIAWLFTAFHHETSIVHGTVAIAIFELGAILVQFSRLFPKALLCRLFVCMGYTCTRIALAYYYGFIIYTCVLFWDSCPLYVQVGYGPILGSLLFLQVLNANWTFLQWKAFAKVLKSETGMDFYSYHQKILGC